MGDHGTNKIQTAFWIARDDLAAIDAGAKQLGINRTTFLRMAAKEKLHKLALEAVRAKHK